MVGGSYRIEGLGSGHLVSREPFQVGRAEQLALAFHLHTTIGAGSQHLGLHVTSLKLHPVAGREGQIRWLRLERELHGSFP